jgi:hypothetical protein
MTTNEIKDIEGDILFNFMKSIPVTDRRFFVRDVIKLCDYRISVKTFYNWQYKACRIPVFGKKAIEKAAGCTLFIWRKPFTE